MAETALRHLFGVTPGDLATRSMHCPSGTALPRRITRARRDWLKATAIFSTDEAMHSQEFLAQQLAEAFAAESLADPAALVDRGARLFGRRYRWLQGVAQRTSANFTGQQRPRTRLIAQFLRSDRLFNQACDRWDLEIPGRLSNPPQMLPSPWEVPSLANPAELSQWLGISQRALAWLADVHGRLCDRPAAVQHYESQWQRKPSGGLRLIEAPRPRLKAIQRRVLRGILEHIPPHDAAHGFRQGRSTQSCVAQHAKQAIVLRLDLNDFFPTFRLTRIMGIFLALGYPECVAALLAALCTTAAPARLWNEASPTDARDALWRSEELYRKRHLPQGAPTSPYLANLGTFHLDRRLAGLARSAGAHYTRYADDLIFSGAAGFARRVARFADHAAAIVLDEGFAVNFRKKRVMRPGVQQRAVGLVLNERPNVPRQEYDRLKATLYNCAKYGPHDQNRENHADFRAHLTGRVGYVASVNPTRAQRLERLLAAIDWS